MIFNIKINDMTDKNKTKYNLRSIIKGKPSPAIKKIVDSLTPEIMDEAKKELEQDSEEDCRLVSEKENFKNYIKGE